VWGSNAALAVVASPYDRLLDNTPRTTPPKHGYLGHDVTARPAEVNWAS
jgi:hypothetical protein